MSFVSKRGRAASAAAILALTGASLVAAISPASASGTFNGGAINTPAEGLVSSAIAVAGQETFVSDVNVTLTGVTTGFVQVIDAVLESPSGTRVTLMSDTACSSNVAGISFSIDDQAATGFPVAPPLVNGTSYKPTDFDPPATGCDGTGDGFGPLGNATTLSALNGSNPNGTWKLHLASDSVGAGVSITGWSLTINATNNGCDNKVATIVGTAGANKIRGTAGDDVIFAGGGKDNVKGLGGNDTICGGDGKDVLKGGAGDDRIFGESGKDQIKGSAGADTCVGGTSKDSFSGCEAATQ